MVLRGRRSHWEAFSGMLDRRGNLGHFDAITIHLLAHFDFSNELSQVVALEEWCELLEEGPHVLKVHEAFALAKLQLEQVEHQSISVQVSVVHVRLDGLGEVTEADLVACTVLVHFLVDGSAKQVEALKLV